ncbi:cytochrome P450 [Polyplosphaeria fusca]|uniref:Cytochrome P450 n=1 Tax=Polyplosphaeria fusca TaxID=682080 RepID=A0A9P4UXS3_9PLEO|nr:cytochrome P450 [Polyplosphaeria fusca]
MALVPLLLKALGLGIIVVLSQYLVAYLSSPLKNLPGPFLAKFSDWWRFFNHYGMKHIETQHALHNKYGSVVRLGPKTVSLNDGSLVKVIYSTRGTFIKSDYYTINDALQDGHLIQNLFSTRDNDFHARSLKPIQKLFSVQGSLELEPLMNDTIRSLCDQLETRFMQGSNAGKTCDIADWISYFTWDFLGDMTFSKRMGFMESGSDVGNMISTAESVMRYFSVVGQIPMLDKLLGKNPYLPYKFADFSVPAGFCVQRFIERMQNLEQFKDKKDYMNGFLEAKKEFPDLVGDNEVIGYLILNILGGADTTAILLKALLYHILKTPRVHTLLTTELRSAPALSFPPSHSALAPLPYLSACIKEALRIHPVVGHILERVVPASGLQLADGTMLPPGTIVGINPWVLTRNTDVYGPRTEEFVPERWMRGAGEGEDEFEARMKGMREADLGFGGGNRTCLGRPLALVELGKVAATLFGKYEIELEDEGREWELHKQWFVWPHDIKVRMRKA